MARSFDGTCYLQHIGTPPVNDSPLTISLLFETDQITNSKCLFSIGRSADTPYSEYFIQRSTDSLIAYSKAGAAGAGATSSAVLVSNTWYHACGVFAADNDRRAYINGVNKGTNITNISPDPATQDNMKVGSRANANDYLQKFVGSTAELGVWNVALTDEEVAILGLRYSPLFVRPQNLVLYLPMIRDEDRDIVGGFTFADVSDCGIATTSPRIYYCGLPTFGPPGEEPEPGGGEVPEAIYVGPHPNQHQKRLRVSLGSQ